jgi:hypothetical protein
MMADVVENDNLISFACHTKKVAHGSSWVGDDRHPKHLNGDIDISSAKASCVPPISSNAST